MTYKSMFANQFNEGIKDLFLELFPFHTYQVAGCFQLFIQDHEKSNIIYDIGGKHESFDVHQENGDLGETDNFLIFLKDYLLHHYNDEVHENLKNSLFGNSIVEFMGGMFDKKLDVCDLFAVTRELTNDSMGESYLLNKEAERLAKEIFHFSRSDMDAVDPFNIHSNDTNKNQEASERIKRQWEFRNGFDIEKSCRNALKLLIYHQRLENGFSILPIHELDFPLISYLNSKSIINSALTYYSSIFRKLNLCMLSSPSNPDPERCKILQNIMQEEWLSSLCQYSIHSEEEDPFFEIRDRLMGESDNSKDEQPEWEEGASFRERVEKEGNGWSSVDEFLEMIEGMGTTFSDETLRAIGESQYEFRTLGETVCYSPVEIDCAREYWRHYDWMESFKLSTQKTSQLFELSTPQTEYGVHSLITHDQLKKIASIFA